MRERIRSTGQATAMIGIIVVTIGGIYTGFFTAGEAAGVGAFLAFLLALARRAVNRTSLTDTLLQTVRTSAFAFLILIGAHVFNPFLALTQIPTDLAALLIGTELPRIGILIILLVVFIILGTFLEGFAILVLTLPIVHPLIIELGYDPIWFGVIALKLTEIGAITPPVGLNVFAVQGAIPKDMNVSLEQVYRACTPFILVDIGVLVLLMVFPQIVLWLPDLLLG